MNDCDGNPNSLKKLADTISVNFQAVNNLEYTSNNLSDAIIVFLASAKLDTRTRKLWETKIVARPAGCDDLLDTFVKCIDERVCTLQAMQPLPPPSHVPGTQYNKKQDDQKGNKTI